MKVFSVNSDGSLNRLSISDYNKIVTAQEDEGTWEFDLAWKTEYMPRFEKNGEWFIDFSVRVEKGAHWKGMEQKTSAGKSDIKMIEDYETKLLAKKFPGFKPGMLSIEYVDGEESSQEGTPFEIDEMAVKHHEEDEFDIMGEEEFDVGGGGRLQAPVQSTPVPQGPGGGDIGGGGDYGGYGGAGTEQHRSPRRERGVQGG